MKKPGQVVVAVVGIAAVFLCGIVVVVKQNEMAGMRKWGHEIEVISGLSSEWARAHVDEMVAVGRRYGMNRGQTLEYGKIIFKAGFTEETAMVGYEESLMRASELGIPVSEAAKQISREIHVLGYNQKDVQQRTIQLAAYSDEILYLSQSIADVRGASALQLQTLLGLDGETFRRLQDEAPETLAVMLLRWVGEVTEDISPEYRPYAIDTLLQEQLGIRDPRASDQIRDAIMEDRIEIIETALVEPTPTPSPTRTPMPTATPSPQMALPYSDEFSDPSSGWDVFSDEDVEAGYSDGEYYVLVKKPNLVSWVKVGRTFSDFRLEVDAGKVAGPDENEFGVVVRHRDDDNFYLFQISSAGYYGVSKQVNREWEALVEWGTSPHIKQGDSTNHLTVIAQGSDFTFYVNGEHLVDVRDASFAEGDIGLSVLSLDEGGVRIHFDNLEVSSPRYPALGWEKIAYVGTDNSIWLMSADGTNKRLVTRDAVTEHDSQGALLHFIRYSHPIWSPNGTQLAFVREEYWSGDADSRSAIFLTSDTGDGLKKVVDDAFSPSWSPDGRTIAYQKHSVCCWQGPEGHSSPDADGIWAIDAATGETRLLVASQSGYSLLRPVWSPHGRYVAFHEAVYEGAGPFRVADLDGGAQFSWHSAVGGFDWSPDGTRLVFDDIFYMQEESKISIANADGTGSYSLLDDPGKLWMNPLWSPDGQTIALQLSAWISPPEEVGGDVGVWVMNTDGTDRRQLTAFEGWPSSWSSEGAQLLVTASDMSIYSVDLDGSDLRKIAEGRSPVWQPIP